MKIPIPIIICSCLIAISSLNAQDRQEEKRNYYEQRAKEDAAYELAMKEDEASEASFWESQQAYEEELEARDKVAYKAYMRGKREAYREHRAHCDEHCHHGPHFEYRASYYYTDYRHRPYRSSAVRLRVGSPRVRIGL